jgi:hypothetical protein
MKTYRPSPGDVIDTTDSTSGETARTIARRILLERYNPFDFADRLEEVIKMNGVL